jgi:hypothetical protein
VWEEENDLPLVFIKENENNTVNNDDKDLRQRYEAWMLLNRKDLEESNFNDFIHVDAEVFTSDFPTDYDILENIQSPLEKTGSKYQNGTDPRKKGAASGGLVAVQDKGLGEASKVLPLPRIWAPSGGL